VNVSVAGFILIIVLLVVLGGLWWTMRSRRLKRR
jgi:hypothetical protein